MAESYEGKTITDNRRARFQYEILETFEAGIELQGTEVKSIRSGRANLQDSFVLIRGGEAWLMNMHVSPYETASRTFNHDPTRRRKLLLHRKEINRLTGLVEQKGLTIVPLKLVLRRGWVKAQVAVARGKKLYDKRETIKDRQQKRDAQRELKERL